MMMGSLLRPIDLSRLPDELFAEIFLACLEPDDIGCIVPSLHSAPLVLTWICRRWRRIALETPRLWAGIALIDQTPLSGFENGGRRQTTTPVVSAAFARNGTRAYVAKRANLSMLLDLWITRSAGSPLAVRFSYTDLWESERGRPMLFLPDTEECAEYIRDMEELTEKLLTCRSRWRALDMSVLDLSVTETLLQAISTAPTAPKLEYLSVATQYLGIFGEVRSYNLALSSQLRSIKILSPLIIPDANASGTNVSLKFQNLSELELKFCSSMSGCLQWIDAAPNLESLVVRFFTAEAQTLQGETRLRLLPHLRILDVTAFSNDSDPGPLLSILRAPALETLKVDSSDLIEAREWTCVQDLLRVSRCRLESLTLLGTPMSAEEIIECLQLVPDVMYLDLGSINDAQLRALTHFPLLQDSSLAVRNLLGDGSPLCPQLKTLVVSDVEECTIDALVRMITSRHKRTVTPFDDDDDADETEEDDARRSSEVPNAEAQGGDVPFKTLEEVIIGYDPHYALVNHPDIIECMEAGLEIDSTVPDGFELLTGGLVEEPFSLSGAFAGI